MEVSCGPPLGGISAAGGGGVGLGWDGLRCSLCVLSLAAAADCAPHSSHYHFDHIGDTTTFPSSTELVVGPGFQAAVLPGYPANPDAPVTEEDLSGRAVREISFSGSVAAPQDLGLQFGGFPAHDFFGDGSFYLLDTPGHCVGHMAGLARTSSATGGQRDTFIMMGGDLCHHGAEIRPSPYLALPEAEAEDLVAGRGGVAAWRELNVKRGRRADGPFADPAVNDDEELAHETIRRTMVADADPDVWFVFAHDTALWEGVDLFPEKANGWREKGWKEKTMWAFLTDLLPAVVGKGQ